MTALGQYDRRGGLTVVPVAAHIAVRHMHIFDRFKMIEADHLANGACLHQLAQFDETIPISALTGEGVEIVIQELMKRLPAGPYFYPEDQLSDQPERAIAAELIREKLIQLTQEELPYSTAVIIEKFEEGERLHRIFANIFVERDSHKAMIIGKEGRLLKEVGISARQDLERMFDRQVYLELHVKVRKGWRDDDESLRQLGFK